MTTSHRDLAQLDPWQRSLDRSLHRRAIAPAMRRSVARRRRASVALSTLMVAGPTGSLLAASGFGIGSRGVDVAQASPANRAIDNGATPAAMAFKLGSHGDAVAEIQRQLGVSADGIFGAQTQAAVTAFQARNGLDVDGVVGPATWTALFGLGQAAAAAGAHDGNVAVIVRERTDATAEGGERESRRAVGGGPSESLGEPVVDLGGSDPAGGDDPSGARDDDPAAPVADTSPRTRPVSTPSPGAGACGPLRLASPVKGMVTSGFGPRWGRNHDGLDIAATTGTPIRAAECGIVSFAGVQSGYGNMVCVKHSSRFETCYAHMTKYAVSQGQRVNQGQVIGYVGCTGTCTGPHLHFETRVDGSAGDPRPYLGGGSVPGAPTVKAAAKPKLTASIRKDVASARTMAKTTTAAPAQAHATTGLTPSAQPVTGAVPTGAPASTPTTAPAPMPAPAATPESAYEQVPAPSYAPPAEPTYEAPAAPGPVPAPDAPRPTRRRRRPTLPRPTGQRRRPSHRRRWKPATRPPPHRRSRCHPHPSRRPIPARCRSRRPRLRRRPRRWALAHQSPLMDSRRLDSTIHQSISKSPRDLDRLKDLPGDLVRADAVDGDPDLVAGEAVVADR
jgi:murein DD-endopeptidase MepM/ murein hydrolase activator NlpD